MNMQPPGWYPDPSGAPDFLRWWDGTAWSDATHPAYPPVESGEGEPAQEDPYQQAWYGQPQEYEDGGYQPGAYPPEAYDQIGYEQGGYQPGGYGQPPQQHGQEWADAGGGWGEPGPGRQRVEERSRRTWPWFVAGGTGLLVIIVVAVVALFATGVVGGLDQGSQNSPPPAPEPSAAGGNSKTPGGSTSPVVGQIKDAKAGISYAKLGGKWAVLQPGGDQGMDNWTAGQYQIAQAEYKPGQDYISTYASAPLAAAAGYGGTSDLQRLTTALAEEVETGYYPQQHTRKDVENKAVTMDGHQAWKITFTLSFPQAESQGWDFHGERVVIMLIDRGEGNAPAAFYFTLPDNLPLQADMDTVLSSIKVID